MATMKILDSFGRLKPQDFHRDARVVVYASSEEGMRRQFLEDGYAIGSTPKASLVGVFDGHGGRAAASFCAKNLFPVLVEDEGFQSGTGIKQALRNAFLKMDDLMREENEQRYWQAGTTAIVAVVTENFVYVAHAGDAFCSYRKGGETKHLTKDHSPHVPEERERGVKADAIFSYGSTASKLYMGIGDSQLLISRALGDLDLKSNKKLAFDEQVIIAVPDVVELEVTEDLEYLVLCSDGYTRRDIQWLDMKSFSMSSGVYREDRQDDGTYAIVLLEKNKAAKLDS
ncbi:hypothetical protein SELMODRAFT_416013 [Selaginella moellendorffii]|uniref:protein-serine/threonine phosphatase n=1 Tax=Selaginella moellendorffii TaxID=88036 RepID=D8RXT2_SELML|nr:hypothetical protein SELMODRAFT_416013 [Selaginella moellendorffii]